MRKMLMRMWRGVLSPGGPCALEVNTATGDVVRGATLETVKGMAASPERLAASASLSHRAFVFVRECTAQCEHGAVG